MILSCFGVNRLVNERTQEQHLSFERKTWNISLLIVALSLLDENLSDEGASVLLAPCKYVFMAAHEHSLALSGHECSEAIMTNQTHSRGWCRGKVITHESSRAFLARRQHNLN